MKRMIRGLMAGATLMLMSSGCLLDDGFVQESGLFFCQSDADCPEARFVCNPLNNTCELETSGPGACIDEDKDNYGVGDDRTQCMFPQEDPDDMDPAIFPGANDICDGKDNDQDGTTDVITCTGSCPQTGVGPDGSIGFCENGTCVYKPANQTPPGCDRALTCNGAAGYEAVPMECMF